MYQGEKIPYTCLRGTYPGSDFPQELRRGIDGGVEGAGGPSGWCALAPVEMLTVPAPYISTRHHTASVT